MHPEKFLIRMVSFLLVSALCLYLFEERRAARVVFLVGLGISLMPVIAAIGLLAADRWRARRRK